MTSAAIMSSLVVDAKPTALEALGKFDNGRAAYGWLKAVSRQNDKDGVHALEVLRCLRYGDELPKVEARWLDSWVHGPRKRDSVKGGWALSLLVSFGHTKRPD